MKKNKEVDKVIRGYEKEFKGDKGLKKNLKAEIDVRYKRHTEEMLRLDGNLEGKSTGEVMEILDGMEERAQGLIGCIDDRIGELEGELDSLDKESKKIDKDTDKAIWWIIGVGVVAIVSVIIAGIMGWI